MSEIRLDLGLNSACLGRVVYYLDSVDSTNSWLTERVENRRLQGPKINEGTALIAGEQTAGRGRLDRAWVSPQGQGLWMSIYLCPDLASSQAFLITFMAAVAVVESLKSFVQGLVQIKWPNDVLLNGRKVSGILTETRTLGDKLEYGILGIGINLNQARHEIRSHFGNRATSLFAETGQITEPKTIGASLLENLDRHYTDLKRGQAAQILTRWRAYAAYFGSKIAIESDHGRFTGFARDVDDYGGLVIETADGQIQAFYSGSLAPIEN